MSLSEIQAQEYKTISSERQSFAEGQIKEFKIPSDTTIKRAVLRLHGSFVLTHSGTPTFDEAGFMGRLITLIQVSQGNDVFKNIDPSIARRLQHLFSGRAPIRRFATNATPPVEPTTEAPTGAPLTNPTSTQTTYIDEEISIDFEDPFASDFMQKQATLWSTHGKNNCRVKVQCSTLANLAEAGAGGTSAVYSSISLNMDLTLVCVPHVRENPDAPFLMYQESLVTLQIPIGSTTYGYQLPKSSSKILGLAALVRQSATAQKLSDTAVKKLKLAANNSRSFIDANFKDLQRSNVRTYGPEGEVMASSRHPLIGFAYASFRRDGDIVNNGIPGDLDSLILGVETSGSGDSPAESGTNVTALVAIHELREQVR